jgi:AcrR family transcriptional regulator
LARSDPLRPRKRPAQRRSQDTVDAILDAAAQVFAERGHARGTTNRIAARAGVSIGSLYEYFPNKDAILVALAERHLERMLGEVASRLEEAQERAGSLGALLRRFVGAMLDAHERNPALHRVVFSEAPHPPALHACVLQMEEGLAHSVEAWLRRSDEVRHPDPDRAAHLVVQTVEALTHRYAHHHTIHDLPREDFVEEVVSLLGSYLRSAGREAG